jgi:hypothetical protein
MSTLAQEEADRFFSQSEHHTSHPEDRIGHDGTSSQSSGSSNQKNRTNYYVHSERDNDDDDEDTLHSMTTNTTTATYRVPTAHFSANTGPKGVISDAQSFTQAKKSSFRNTLTAFSNGAHSAFSHTSQQRKVSDWNKENGFGDNSDNEPGASDEEDFMRQWREKRLAELAAAGSAAQRRQSPSKRVWGTFDDVDANGYLDAVEKVPDDAIVVVCIYDPLVCQLATPMTPSVNTTAYELDFATPLVFTILFIFRLLLSPLPPSSSLFMPYLWCTRLFYFPSPTLAPPSRTVSPISPGNTSPRALSS